MTIQKLLASAASVALLGSMFATSVFASELEISGNGSDSDNKIKVTDVCVSKVSQYNKTSANTWVTASAQTGGNVASGNTGGDVSVDTGNATTDVTVVVTGGDNKAEVPSCCDCGGTDASASITGNGTDSDNKIKVKDVKVTKSRQTSKTYANTWVTAKSKTGRNKAKNNTGGSVEVKTGDGETTVGVEVAGGHNTLD